MNKLLTLLLAFTMTPLFAGVSGSMALTSDYFFRGASQTMGSSALQGGVDYNNALDDTNKIRSAFGASANIYTTIGPLSFTVAQDLSKAANDETETFNFRLGTSF